MNTSINRPPGRRVRCARWLGLDHNPLRRTTDRLEAWLRLAGLVLLMIAVPLGALMCGRTADHVLAGQAWVQHRSDHLVSAVLTQAAPSEPYGSYMADTGVWVQARWTAPDGGRRSGQVLAPGGTSAGRTVQIWVDPAGASVEPPAGHEDVVDSAFAVGVISGLFLVLLLMASQAIAQHALDRRRLAAWGTAWRATGPRWSNHRS